MSKQTLPWKDSASISGLAPRRPDRFTLQYSIEVCGFDRCGRFFTERSETCNISDAGCKFYLRTEVDRDAVLALRLTDRYDRRGNDAAPVLFQVARIERATFGWTLGAQRLQSDELWPVQGVPSRGGSRAFD